MNPAASRIDLAREPDFILGSLKVRPARRQLVEDGAEKLVEPRVMQVLVALVRRANEVLSRDELLEACWAGLVVGEDAIQRAVAKVRHLGNKSGAFAIETIPRVGYRLVPANGAGSTAASGGNVLPDPAQGITKAVQALNRLPSIGVLPFVNLTGDADRDYLVDGITEGIITALSRFREFRTAPRGATFAYRGYAGDPSEAGRQLGLKYVLTGTVQLAAQRIRATIELTTCDTGRQIWRDTFDRTVTGMFELQDELSRNVAAMLFPALRGAEVAQAGLVSAPDMTAYDLYLRALPCVWAGGREDILLAIDLLHQSLGREANAAALSTLAFALMLAPPLGAVSPQTALPEALRLARRALELDPSDAFTHATYSTALSINSTDYAQVTLHAEEAVRLNPGSAFAWGALGISRCLIGEYEQGLAGLKAAIDLSPSDILVYFWRTFEAAADFGLERFEEGVAAARCAIMHNPSYGTAHRLLAANLVSLGRVREAQDVTHRRDREQTTSLAEIRSMGLFQQATVMDRYIEAQGLCGVT